MRIQEIAFNIDGSLLDAEDTIVRSLQTALRETGGRELPLDKLYFALGIPADEALPLLRVRDPERVLSAWLREMDRHRDEIRPWPGTREMLEGLRAMDIHLGIITSRTRPLLTADLDRLDLRPYFDTIITAEDSVRHKPSPEPAEAYWRQNGRDPKAQNAYFLGSTSFDFITSTAVGFTFVIADYLEKPRLCPGDIRVKNPADFLSWVQNYNANQV